MKMETKRQEETKLRVKQKKYNADILRKKEEITTVK